jgi:hypothetical protein
LHLELGYLEALVPSDRLAAELDAVLGPRLILDLLVRRPARGDYQQLVEAELQVGLLRADQVAEVGRVERAAEDSQARQAQLTP